MTVLFKILMRQILTDDFWGFHKNMNNEYAVLIPHANTQSPEKDLFVLHNLKLQKIKLLTFLHFFSYVDDN